MCIPSTSASVAITIRLYRKFSKLSSISKACCNRLNSSFSYTIFFFRPKQFNGFPRKLKTAWRLGSLLLVMEPLAESPSVINRVVSNRVSCLVSGRWYRQSRSFLLCKLARFARSLANFCTPAMSLRSRSFCKIFFSNASATVGFLCK